MTVGDQIRALPGSGINQTSFMFGAVLFAYLFFITTRGDLGKWLGLLGLAGVTGAATASTPASLNPAQNPLAGASTGAGGLT